jgi:hypothetical protein
MKTRSLNTCLILILAAAFPLACLAQTGNGATSGSHYNLNLIGQDTCKSQPLTDSNRHTIFVDLNFHDGTPTDPTSTVSLNSKNKIFLQEGPFQVIDGNACDGAIFQLPKNDCATLTVPTVSGCDYDVYIRGLGSPQGNPYALMTTCRKDNTTDTFQCSTETVRVDRLKGKSSFDNVTKELTTLCLNTDLIAGCDTRVTLFESSMYQYFWDYDNFGLRLAQLRFYPRVP